MLFSGKLNQDQFFAWLNPPGMELEEHYDRTRLLSQFAEVDEETYDYFLNQLPPMHWSHSGFAICEATTDDLRLGFFRIQGRFFAAYVSDHDRTRSMTATRAAIVDSLVESLP